MRLETCAIDSIYLRILANLHCNCCSRCGRKAFKKIITHLTLPQTFKNLLDKKYCENHIQIQIFISYCYHPFVCHSNIMQCAVSFHKIKDASYIMTNRIIPHFKYTSNMCLRFINYYTSNNNDQTLYVFRHNVDFEYFIFVTTKNTITQSFPLIWKNFTCAKYIENLVNKIH